MAVYTDVNENELSAFLKAYPVGELLSYKGIAEGTENSNFLVHASTGSYILTLYEKRVDKADLPFFLGLMGHLARKGISCPLPVTAHDGTVIGTLAGRPADEVEPGLAAEVDADFLDFGRNWPTRLPQGIIHADLFPDNVFFLGEKLSGLIDFYFACDDLYAYDVATCLNAWCFEKDFSFNLTKGAALLAGYQSVRPLEGEEKAALPMLARGSALRFMLTRLYDWLTIPNGGLVMKRDPTEYIRRMRFHRAIKSPSEYGLT
ncbi:homoserine kinase [Mesorhizobium sp.]|uniref:homoserine kinase n=1 Tax=Mesorhizobium sp. TaxID=1871066 RepID=UPI000FE66EDB|nr:homoserine kinase [Mesorhizobium sp.]RWF79266.1 MAG: homoserine kinase [Mesorhizobium sp.]